MPEDKKPKFVQAVVDRVVSNIIVADIRHPDASEDDPDKQLYFSKSTYCNDKCHDKELFTAFVRQIAFKGYTNNIQFEGVNFGSERIPNKF